jgi:hypothetical protein
MYRKAQIFILTPISLPRKSASEHPPLSLQASLFFVFAGGTRGGRTSLLERRIASNFLKNEDVSDNLPEFFEEPIAPHNAVWDFTSKEIG